MPDLKAIRKKLLKWYKDNKRVLPWRDIQDPYATWVSEVMLQQTQVKTVLKYYDNFMNQFPSLEDLADASEDEVMAAWSGLGYYRRAKFLHRGVQEVQAKYGGQIPKEPKERLLLPGVGKYTAGAIGSIALNQEEAVVDGNVSRVYARVFNIDSEIKSKEAQKEFWTLAEKLVQGKHPGEYNQAIMELGALICSPRSPSCLECPLSKECFAFKNGIVDHLPFVAKRKKAKEVEFYLLLIQKKHRKSRKVLLLKNQKNRFFEKNKIFKGLWNFPLFEIKNKDSNVEGLAQELSIQKRDLKKLGHITHTLSHLKLKAHVFLLVDHSFQNYLEAEAFDFVDMDKMPSLGISSFTRKAFELIVKKDKEKF